MILRLQVSELRSRAVAYIRERFFPRLRGWLSSLPQVRSRPAHSARANCVQLTDERMDDNTMMSRPQTRAIYEVSSGVSYNNPPCAVRNIQFWH